MLTIYGPPAVTLTIKTKPPIGVCKATNLALKSDFGCTWCSSLTTSQKIGGKAFLRGVPQTPQRVSIRASNWSTTDWIVIVLMLSSPSALCRGCCECEAPVNTHQPASTAADCCRQRDERTAWQRQACLLLGWWRLQPPARGTSQRCARRDTENSQGSQEPPNRCWCDLIRPRRGVR